MDIFYSDNKTDLKLRCDHCIKFHLFEDAQDVYSRLTAVCCMLLQHSPYRLPQHYKRHVCESTCSCKHRFCRYLLFLSIRFVWVICIQYAIDNPSSQESVHFIEQCWNFNTRSTQVQAINEVSSVWTVYVSWDEMSSYYVSMYKLGFLEGFSRWRGYIM
jgi:hypothetical protein